MHRRGTARGKQGPALPFSISKAISGQDPGSERNGRTSKAYALKDRKAQRKASRRQKGQQKYQSAQRSHGAQTENNGFATSHKRQRTDSTANKVCLKVHSGHAKPLQTSAKLLQTQAPVSKKRKTNALETRKEPVSVAPHHKPVSKPAGKSNKGKKSGSKFDKLLQITAADVSPAQNSCLMQVHVILCMPTEIADSVHTILLRLYCITYVLLSMPIYSKLNKPAVWCPHPSTKGTSPFTSYV